MSKVIESSGLLKLYGSHEALARVDFNMQAGERVALIGANGAGKTTLMRAILGQIKVQGSLKIMGLDPRKDRTQLFSSIAYVPQAAPPLTFTVNELIKLTARLCRNTSEENVARMVQKLDLDINLIGNKLFTELSGGQRQKILIALALAKEPKLVILDEPASNLDPAGRSVLYQRLAELPQDTAMVLCSHRVDEVFGLITRVAEMDLGRIKMDTPIDAGFAAGEHFAVSLTLKGVNGHASEVLEEWGLKKEGAENSFTGKVPAEDRLRFMHALFSLGGKIENLNIH